MDPTSRRAAAGMLLVTLLWGAYFPAGKVAVALAAPAMVATLRFALAGLILVALLAWREPAALRPRVADWPLALGLGLTGGAAYNLAVFAGLGHAPAADASMITPGLNPLLTLIGASVIFGEPLGWRRLVALGLGLVGLGLIVGEQALAAAAGPDRLYGDALFALAAVAWSAYTLLGRRAAGRFSPLASATYAALGGLPLMAIAAGPAWLTTPWASLPASFWGAIAFMAIGCTVIAFLLFMDAIARVGAAGTAVWLLLIPVFGVALGALILGEQPSAIQVLGMAVTIVGVGTATLSPSPAR